jgi:hypothetical protein
VCATPWPSIRRYDSTFRHLLPRGAFASREAGGVLLTVGEIKEKKEKGKEGEGEKRESVEEMALI